MTTNALPHAVTIFCALLVASAVGNSPVTLPSGLTLPSGATLPTGLTLPSSVTLPSGVTLPTLPSGMTWPPGFFATPQPTTVATPPTPPSGKRSAGEQCSAPTDCESNRCLAGFCCALGEQSSFSNYHSPRKVCNTCAKGTGICTNCNSGYYATYGPGECSKRLTGGRSCAFNDQCEDKFKDVSTCLGGRCCGVINGTDKCTACSSTLGKCASCQDGFRILETPGSSISLCVAPLGGGSPCAADKDCKSKTCKSKGDGFGMVCCGAADENCDACSAANGTCVRCKTGYALANGTCDLVPPTPMPSPDATDAGKACTSHSSCETNRCLGGFCCAYPITSDGKYMGRFSCTACANRTGLCTACKVDRPRVTNNSHECIGRLNTGRSCTADNQCISLACRGGYCCDTYHVASNKERCRVCASQTGYCRSCHPQFVFDAGQLNYGKLPQCRAPAANGAECNANSDCASNTCRSNAEGSISGLPKKVCCAANVDPECSVCSQKQNGICTNCSAGYNFTANDTCVPLATPAPTPAPVASDAGKSCTSNGECTSNRCRGGFCCAYDSAKNLPGPSWWDKESTLLLSRVQCTACANGTGTCVTCSPNNFVTDSPTECAMKRTAGSTCNVDENCDTNACRKGRCCSGAVNLSTCDTCLSSGLCSSCSPGCTKCDEAVGICDECAPGYVKIETNCVRADQTVVPTPVPATATPETTPTPTPTSNGTRAPPGPPLSGSAVITFTFTDDSPYEKAKFDAGMQSLLGADPSQYTVIQTGPNEIEVRFTGSDKAQLAQKLGAAMENDVDVAATLGAATVSTPAPTPAPTSSPTAAATPAADESSGLPIMYIAIAGGVLAVIIVGTIVGCVLMKRKGSDDPKAREAEDVRQITVYEKNPETPGEAQCGADEAAV